MNENLNDKTDDRLEPRRPSRPAAERGSAMIVALMVMVILTMLGITFVVLAEQEQQISVNERDLTQALYIAEAGVEVAKTWFNRPDPATNPFKPVIGEMTRTLRRGHTLAEGYTNADERNAPTDDLSGILYSGGGGLPFEKPYRGALSEQLHGRRDTPDVLLCQEGEEVDLDGDGSDDCISGAAGFMARLNAALLSMPSPEHSARDLGEVAVQQIRVYRPPVDFTLRNRYGIATIEAISVKKVRGGRIVTQRAVRDVVQEIPFPGPGGAIETESDVGQGGSAGVHWGPVVSAAFDDVNDNINLPGNQSANFPQPAVPRDTPARWGFHHTINPASGNNLSDVAPPNGPTGGQAFTALTELLGITKNGSTSGADNNPVRVGDPWLLFRARNRITIGGDALRDGTQPGAYTSLTNTVVGNAANRRFNHNDNAYNADTPSPTWSHMFQRQIVRFPPMSYETWKEVVRSGQDGMFYFSYVPASNPPTWRLNGSGTPQSFSYWVNRVRANNLGPGVYFFDTVDSIAPHDDNDDGVADNLTPGTRFEKVGADEAYMEGFALLYAEFLNSTGVGKGMPVDVNMPGEVFLDDGIDLNDGSGQGDNCICIRIDKASADKDCVLGLAPIQWGSGNLVRGPAALDAKCTAAELATVNAGPQAIRLKEAETFRNGKWDADLNNDGEPDESIGPATPGWATFVGAPNAEGTAGHAFPAGRLPYYPTARARTPGQFANDRFRDPRFFNRNDVFGGARQVHEPFLNFDYPTNGDAIVGWGNAAANGVHVRFSHSGDAVDCDRINEGRTCQTITKRTTVSRDARGGLMTLNLNVNGVLYCDGYYTGTGNLKVYGSMMMRGGYVGSASLDVWFNEELVEGLFPPASWELPRIYTSARDTD